MPQRKKREPLTDLLVADFPRFLHAFEENCPFNRYGQLEYHVKTIKRLKECGSVGRALADESFLRSLHDTLQVWGIGARGSNLKPLAQFASALRQRESEIASFAGIALDQPGLDAEPTSSRLWQLINTLDVVTNNQKIVAGTKALHHLLPELVVPMDGAYTKPFFGWHNPQFQYGQEGCFREAFMAFAKIARAANPRQYVSVGWSSSITKLIDNAVVGVFCYANSQASGGQGPA